MKEGILLLHENPRKIDHLYFENYGGDNYSRSYLNATTPPTKVIEDLIDVGIFLESLLDVGCASGELVRDFRRLGVKAFGIDNNKEILKKSVVPQFCKEMDLRDLSQIKSKAFSCIYANVLMYVYPSEIQDILKGFYRICEKAVYLCNPFLEDCYGNNFPDPSRVFLAKEVWWDKQFQETGFRKLAPSIYAKDTFKI